MDRLKGAVDCAADIRSELSHRSQLTVQITHEHSHVAAILVRHRGGASIREIDHGSRSCTATAGGEGHRHDRHSHVSEQNVACNIMAIA